MKLKKGTFKPDEKVKVVAMEKNDRRMGRRMLQVYEEIAPFVLDAVTKLKATCKLGCAHCCMLLNYISFPEAVAIAEFVIKEDRLRKQLPSITATLMTQLKDVSVSGNIQEARRSYFDRRNPCVFLSSEKACLIHPVRPASCRLHYVISDPELCNPLAVTDIVRIDLRAVELHVSSEAHRVSRQAGFDFLMGPFQVMVMWAIKLLIEGRSEVMKAVADPNRDSLNLLYWKVTGFDPSRLILFSRSASMGLDLRSALVSAGLVSAEKAAEAERQVEQQRVDDEIRAEYNRRIRLYPRNRFGRPIALAEWMLQQRRPPDLKDRCCHCGQIGLHLEQAVIQVIDDAFFKRGTAKSLDEMYTQAMTKAIDLRDRGKILTRYDTSFSPPPIRDYYGGHETFLCRACSVYAFRSALS